MLLVGTARMLADQGFCGCAVMVCCLGLVLSSGSLSGVASTHVRFAYGEGGFGEIILAGIGCDAVALRGDARCERLFTQT